jgi:curved DNA-binding protein CbpA
MSVDTLYGVLGLPENTSSADIKTAYRNLIKQVHPDTLAALSPYLRRIAEDRAKDMIEAYSVLSDREKRRQYDRALAEYRQTSAGPIPTQQSPPVTSRPTRRGSRPAQIWVTWHVGYDWLPLRRWLRRISRTVYFLGMIAVLAIVVVALRNSRKAASPKAPVVADDSSLSYFPPVLPSSGAHGFDGIYSGTVHNKTAGVAAPFRIFLQQRAGGVLDGCIDVKPPLAASGSVHGSIRGSHVDFIVNNTRFQGSLRGRGVAGSFVVKNEGRQESGSFQAARPIGMSREYACNDGTVSEIWTP